MLIPSVSIEISMEMSSLSRRVNANSQPNCINNNIRFKLIKKGEC